MKLPRWVVVCLLGTSAIALVTPGYWWLTTPKRCCDTFIELISHRKLAEANKMLNPSTLHPRITIVIDEDLGFSHCKFEGRKRTLMDFFLGQQRFEHTGGEFDYELVVERGAVTLNRTRMFMMFNNPTMQRELGFCLTVEKFISVGEDEEEDGLKTLSVNDESLSGYARSVLSELK
jgi:hypothetical protein